MRYLRGIPGNHNPDESETVKFGIRIIENLYGKKYLKKKKIKNFSRIFTGKYRIFGKFRPFGYSEGPETKKFGFRTLYYPGNKHKSVLNAKKIFSGIFPEIGFPQIPGKL